VISFSTQNKPQSNPSSKKSIYSQFSNKFQSTRTNPAYKQLQSGAGKMTFEMLKKILPIEDVEKNEQTVNNFISGIKNSKTVKQVAVESANLLENGLEQVLNTMNLTVIPGNMNKDKLLKLFGKLKYHRKRIRKGQSPYTWKQICSLFRARMGCVGKKSDLSSPLPIPSLKGKDGTSPLIVSGTRDSSFFCTYRRFFYWLCNFLISCEDLHIHIDRKIFEYILWLICDSSLFCERYNN
jgi:hypothetical protein